MNVTHPLSPPHLDHTGAWILSRYGDVTAVLSDPRNLIPAIAAGNDPIGTVGWLRSRVARFSNGAVHNQRRDVCQTELARMGTDILRREAYRRASNILDAASGTDIDIMSTVARSVPVGVMALHLRVPESRMMMAVDAVIEVSKVYLATEDWPTPQADAAVLTLLQVLPRNEPEIAANRIGLLVQACEATAGLIGSALVAWATHPGLGINSTRLVPFVLESMRLDPPVRVMRRTLTVPLTLSGKRIPTEATVVLNIATANRDPDAFERPHEFDPDREAPSQLGFGVGLRPCPGSDHALALAAAVFSAVTARCTSRAVQVSYGEQSTLRIPSSLVVSIS